MGSVINIEKYKTRKGFGIYKYPWGIGIRDETIEKWVHIIINSPKGLEPVEFELYADVILHENGIEFV